MTVRESDYVGGGVRVAAVGDVQLGDSSACMGWGFASRHSNNSLDPVFEGVSQHLVADVTIGNLETMLSRAGVEETRWTSTQMRGYPHYAKSLHRAGFTVLNVANNHAAQHGPTAFVETVEALRGVGLQVCGLRGEGKWSSMPAVVQLPNRTQIGCLGYSMRPRQFSQAQPPYAEGAPQRILSDVARLSGRVQHVIVSLHWGEEFVGDPSQEQVTFAHELMEAGVSAILGHHPHVLGPIEQFRNGVIAYSLGNFVTDMLWREELRTGAVLSLELSSDGATAIGLLPTRVDGDYRVLVGDLDVGDARTGPISGLPESEYRKQVKKTVRAFMMAKYRYALKHIFRYPPTMLRQLLLQTLKNKLGLAREEPTRPT